MVYYETQMGTAKGHELSTFGSTVETGPFPSSVAEKTYVVTVFSTTPYEVQSVS
jgi:hypothetical protein